MPVGEPGGPDTEMFYDFRPDLGRSCIPGTPFSGEFCHVNCDCGRFLEIGNNVFMQYKKTETGFEELPKMNVDFGGGLERVCAAINNNPDVFMVDIFESAKATIERISGVMYGTSQKTTYAYRVILDHLRAATFLIADGVVPSNKDQGYFTRRLVRRAIRHARDLHIDIQFVSEIASSYIDIYNKQYPELLKNREYILAELSKEEDQFGKTLKDGMKEFEKLVRGFQIAFERTGEKIVVIAGEKAFRLYDTYGFPIEMTEELAKEQGLSIDMS
jgi:alanyl-tRNA synthetase